jgi:hypothetical protein
MSSDRGAIDTSARLSAGPRLEGDRTAPQNLWPQTQVRRVFHMTGAGA